MGCRGVISPLLITKRKCCPKFFFGFTAFMCLIFCKDSASERNESLLSNCRVQLIFYKDSASERNESLLSES